ncbi:rho guanine nucleotide exchange factor 11 isoform X2 [Leptopilina heterotoma]|uniref:rho guanine nucleotide exchange factor 11 isoform X2 n=1 Tax=Leptopilina heterotoma TaxID=63436 RepID=UPI001CA81946|nr:rho guanine nucleotide exchange factor 11 isoform X2 [Leptopilina heterotoma]
MCDYCLIRRNTILYMRTPTTYHLKRAWDQAPVELYLASTEVVLTVQQKPVSSGASGLPGDHPGQQQQQQQQQHHYHHPVGITTVGTMVSPSQPATSLHRAFTAPAGGVSCTDRITGPQPVDVSPYHHHHRTNSGIAFHIYSNENNNNNHHHNTSKSPRLDSYFSPASSFSPDSPSRLLRNPRTWRLFASTPVVNHEKKRELETAKVHTIQLMLEKEQSYVDKLRSELAKVGAGNSNSIASLQTELNGAERRVRVLQERLKAVSNNDHLCSVTNTSSSPSHLAVLDLPSSSRCCDIPPPLPSRKSLSMQSLSPPPLPPRPLPPTSNTHNTVQLERQLLSHIMPPTTGHGIPYSLSQGAHLGSPSSLNKHHRTKSSPEQLSTTMISPAEASRLLIASESMKDLSPPRHGRHSGIDLDDPPHITPPGTPPPPYPPSSNNSISSGLNDSYSFLTTSSPKHNASLGESSPGLPTVQKPIISMEDDDMSDQEVGQLEDHGPFKYLSKLWGHHAHLAVFINYVLSTNDLSSLLFYLITDLYKEGNAKEMRKWAYEIHSSFLVPGAPLRLNNVDENVAREIDDVLLKESDKEEILRKIFWKARARAKEELNEQLADFQVKRIAGLGTLFGPCDPELDESKSDKSREIKIIEKYLLPKVEAYLEDIEKENVDLRQFLTAAGLATVLTKIFQIRPVSIERVPIFVAKDKTNIKARLLTGKSRKMTIRGHHFIAHQYFTVDYCNHCQNIICGIGPQGYQCNNCTLNVHRQCVRVVEENCTGPLVRKEKGNDRISKFMERIRPERKPPSHHHHHHNQNHMHFIERIKRSEEEATLTDGENGDHRGGGATGSTRSSSERGRVSAYGGGSDHADSMDDPSSREDISEMVQQHISSKPKTSNINRSESYKERIHHKRQVREKRKTSDPNLSKTNDCDTTGAFPGNSAGSSSNSSLSTRSLDSPSTSLEQVPTTSASNTSTSWDSDVDVEPDPPDWSHGVAEEVLARLSNSEKKRQEVINELFHTERSHVRALKVLSQVFHKPLLESQVLPVDQIHLLFSNLDEMVTIHSSFNQAMKRKKKENPCVEDVGELLLEMFDGEAGDAFECAASIYCAKQQVALDALRDRRRKDPKLNSFLNEVEANPLCRRLQLKDQILTGMLRLTKYPLLFENLTKYTPETNEKERSAINRSLERSKEILSRVNQSVKEYEDYQRLAEIQRTIDKSAFEKCTDNPTVQEFKNLDFTKRRLIFEGPLQWRIVNRAKLVDLHVVLLDDIIVLLQRQDEKYLLKLVNSQPSTVLSPIVKISTVLVRHNAVDHNSIYLVNTSQNGAQIYELVASSQAERKLWFKHISDTVEAYKTKDREGRRPTPSATIAQEITPLSEEPSAPETEVIGEKLDHEKESKESIEEATSTTTATATTTTTTRAKEEEETPDAPEIPEASEKAQQPKTEVHAPGIGETLRIVTCTQCSLIEPDEVHIEEPLILVAEEVITPIEHLRRKDEAIKQALTEKQALVADMLNLSREDFEHVADIAAEPSELEKEPAELILAAINQANQLVEMLNSALTVSESEIVLATRGASSSPAGCEATSCSSSRVEPQIQQRTVPVTNLQPICTTLNTQLTELLRIVKVREDERENLRRELRRSREKLHAMDNKAQREENLVTSTSNIHTQTEIDEEPKGESCSEQANKDDFVDAESEPENEIEEGEEKVKAVTEVMGDSVG